MMNCHHPRRDIPPLPARDPAVTALHPDLNRLTDAWTLACRHDPRVAGIAAQCPSLRPFAMRVGGWVLRGLTDQGSVVTARITASDVLSILCIGATARPVAIWLALPVAA